MPSSPLLSFLLLAFNSYIFGIITVNGQLIFGCSSTPFICPHGDIYYAESCAAPSISFVPIAPTTSACQPCRNLMVKHESNCKGTRCDGYDARSTVSGCSADGFTDYMHLWFRESCDMHDVCYRTHGVPKEACDDTFKKNMLRQCGANIQCITSATIAHQVVAGHDRAMSSYTDAQAKAKDCGVPFWTNIPIVGGVIFRRRLLMTEISNEAVSVPNGLETRFYLSFGDEFEDSLLNDQDLLNEFSSAVGKILNEILSVITENTMNYVELGHIAGFGHIDNVNQADGDKFHSILKDDTLNKYAYLNIKFDVHSTDLSMLKSYLLADGIATKINEAIEYELKLVGKDVFGGLNVHLVDASLY